jgi:hypothetical protein
MQPLVGPWRRGGVISTTYNKAAQEKRSAVGFVMTIYRRRLASSFFALQRTLADRLGRLGRAGDAAEIDEEVSRLG